VKLNKQALIAAVLIPTAFHLNVAIALDPIEVPSALLTLLDDISVAAREEGLLTAINVSEGDLVTEDQIIAQIDDDQIRFAKRTAEIEVEVARDAAENDLPVQAYQKAAQVAAAELERAERSDREFRGSVSDTELGRLRLAAEQARLQWEQSKRDLKMAGLTLKLKENELQLAEDSLARRRILAPLEGTVVEIKRRPGEWVMPGETVLRVVRTDILRAEGFLEAADYTRAQRGQSVVFEIETPQGVVRYPGRLTFVSPEFDPLHRQTRILAEIANETNQLQAGVRGKLIIAATPSE
jgi:RND family efflux transporter MFP subunit